MNEVLRPVFRSATMSDFILAFLTISGLFQIAKMLTTADADQGKNKLMLCYYCRKAIYLFVSNHHHHITIIDFQKHFMTLSLAFCHVGLCVMLFSKACYKYLNYKSLN